MYEYFYKKEIEAFSFLKIPMIFLGLSHLDSGCKKEEVFISSMSVPALSVTENMMEAIFHLREWIRKLI